MVLWQEGRGVGWVCFFFNATATTEIYTLSLHDALPIFPDGAALRAWYNSPDYQALVPLRDEAADMVFIAADEMT